jgi:competence protein ComEA
MMIPRSHFFLDNHPLSTALLSLTLILSLSACGKRVRHASLSIHTAANDQQSAATNQQTLRRINVNTASANELETLPGIGKGLAARIVEHREKWGAFRRPEHLITVRGISDKRFRGLRELITVE